MGSGGSRSLCSPSKLVGRAFWPAVILPFGFSFQVKPIFSSLPLGYAIANPTYALFFTALWKSVGVSGFCFTSAGQLDDPNALGVIWSSLTGN